MSKEDANMETFLKAFKKPGIEQKSLPTDVSV